MPTFAVGTWPETGVDILTFSVSWASSASFQFGMETACCNGSDRILNPPGAIGTGDPNPGTVITDGLMAATTPSSLLDLCPDSGGAAEVRVYLFNALGSVFSPGDAVLWARVHVDAGNVVIDETGQYSGAPCLSPIETLP